MASRVLVSTRLPASAERVFEAFTREIGVWWRPNPLFEITSGGAGVLAFEGGAGGRLVERKASGEVFVVGRITAWEPPSRLAFSWRQASFAPDQHTQVEVRFDPLRAQTRITVEHSGWDGLPAAHAARHGFPDDVFLRRWAEWWQTLLAALGSSTIDTQLRPFDGGEGTPER